jgi:NADH:ubiquinone oxidoreductase subunit
MKKSSLVLLFLIGVSLLVVSCSRKESSQAGKPIKHSLLLSLSVFGENEDGSIKTLPAELGVLSHDGKQWVHRSFTDEQSNVFHKTMAYGTEGILSMGGTDAMVKLWKPDGDRELLWQADFGGTFSRMRDVEVGDIYGDGKLSMAIATHDQGVVATLRPNDEGGFSLEELDREDDMFVHEIELGDLNGDGVLEIYATPSEPNKMDGSEQYGTVTRYIPAIEEGRYEVADLEGKHAKEILVTDIDGDGKDELYVSIEAVSGGQVEIRRYLEDTYPTEGEIIATLEDKLCRFLTVGDVDGDGTLEMVAAANEAGLWLLRPRDGRWTKELIDDQTSSFEHASILEDLDGDGRDELYVASDNQGEFRRYDWSAEKWTHEVLYKYEEGVEPLTWNIMAVPNELIPAFDTEITDVETDETIVTTPEVEEEEQPAVPRGLIINSAEATPGYVLYSPGGSTFTYLLNHAGKVVHSWESDYKPSAMYLLPNGNLLRGGREPEPPVFKGGGQAGRIQEFSWDGELLWDFKYANEDHLQHHDIEPLPNGNILAIAWESKDAQEANRIGRRPDLIPKVGIWPTRIIEIEPQRPNGGRIVWEWHAWDHLIQDFDPEKANYGDPAAHPELIDINGDNQPLEIDPEELARLKAIGYVPEDANQEDLRSDLFHVNGIDYNEELDQIVLSSWVRSEVWIIDHSTTTEEAASHSGGRWGKGGDILYRWGNPSGYGRGSEEQQTLFHQHNVQWIPEEHPGAGNLLVFNNRLKTPEGNHSAIYEWTTPRHPDGSYVIPDEGALGPDQPLWKYEAPDKTSFYSSNISGTHRLPNGNTFICSGRNGRFMEVTPDGEIVWEYWDPFSDESKDADSTYSVFRATKLTMDHPGLQGRVFEPLKPQPKTALERKAEKENPPRGLILNTNKAAPGYVLYVPFGSHVTYLINKEGAVVHTWENINAEAGGLYLLDNGNLLLSAREPNPPVFKGGGQAGRIQEISWDGELLWDFKYANEDHLNHHDIEPLPNGNVLAVAWESKSAQEASKAGRRADLIPKTGVWPIHIIEVEPKRPNGGRIVWEWHAWDHLIQDFDPQLENFGNPSQHPERININGEADAPDMAPEELARLKALGYVPGTADADDERSDLFHVNAVDYNADLDQIALSSYKFNEIWIIDHSTTTVEAAGRSGGRYGKGGELLYRWGNPKNYNRGGKEDQKLFKQHNIQWIAKGLPGAGNLLVYNNDIEDSNGNHSAIFELEPPTQTDGSYMIPANGPIGPNEPIWKYEAPDKISFYSDFVSGTQRLANGNTLICEGDDGRLFEVTPEGEIAWEFWDPFSAKSKDGSNNSYGAFRATNLNPSHPGLAGRALDPISPQPKTALERKAERKAKEDARGLLINTDQAAPGYTLFSPGSSGNTYLIDLEGTVVHSWESEYAPGESEYLLENGNLLRTAQEPETLFKSGGTGGHLQEFSWSGELLWQWTHATEDYWLHHDVEKLPNGNILAIAWEKKSHQEASAAGRRPELNPEAGIWPDKVIEIEQQYPDGARIVWEWHAWDHLIQDFDPEKENFGDPSKHPERININSGAKAVEFDPEELARLKALGYVPENASEDDLRSDMMHCNAVDYNAELDQIVLSSRYLNEIIIIDHSTTTAEAAGHSGGRWGKGGDLLYRWGNPQNYNRGTDKDHKLFDQHDVNWIASGYPDAGKLMVYNNSLPSPKGEFSAVDVIDPPTHADGSYVIPNEGPIGPDRQTWRYRASNRTSFHSAFISGARRLPNGNTLICEGDDGKFFEVNLDGDIVWEYWEPYSGSIDQAPRNGTLLHTAFRATRLSPDYPGLQGRDLKPLDPQPLRAGVEVVGAE